MHLSCRYRLRMSLKAIACLNERHITADCGLSSIPTSDKPLRWTSDCWTPARQTFRIDSMELCLRREVSSRALSYDDRQTNKGNTSRRDVLVTRYLLLLVIIFFCKVEGLRRRLLGSWPCLYSLCNISMSINTEKGTSRNKGPSEWVVPLTRSAQFSTNLSHGFLFCLNASRKIRAHEMSRGPQWIYLRLCRMQTYGS
jgi:hypothetical protein